MCTVDKVPINRSGHFSAVVARVIKATRVLNSKNAPSTQSTMTAATECEIRYDFSFTADGVRQQLQTVKAILLMQHIVLCTLQAFLENESADMIMKSGTDATAVAAVPVSSAVRSIPSNTFSKRSFPPAFGITSYNQSISNPIDSIEDRGKGRSSILSLFTSRYI